MTLEIVLVLGILFTAIVLFVSQRLRVDVVALLVLGALALAGLVSAEEAISGFSNPAVVTIWAVFILSGGLSRTGVANIIGRHVLRLAGNGYPRLLLVIMLITALLSPLMNNTGVTAMFLPIVLDISRRTGYASSKLLLPMVYTTLIGGMTVLISTSTNILVSDAMASAGLEPFGFFDFTPPALALLLAGMAVLFVTARWLLPTHKSVHEILRPDDTLETYALEERLAVITLPKETPLADKTLAECRIGEALGLTILGVRRQNQRHMAPDPGMKLQGGDLLLVLGRLDRLDQLIQQPSLMVIEEATPLSRLLEDGLCLAEFTVRPGSQFIGSTLNQVRVRQEYGVNVLAISRNGHTISTHLQNIPIQSGDRVLLQGPQEQMERYRDQPNFRIVDEETAHSYGIEKSLLTVQVTANSNLHGNTLLESRLANTYGLDVLVIKRGDQVLTMPGPETRLESGDVLIVTGQPRDLEIVRGLQNLELDRNPNIDLSLLQSGSARLVGAMLSPFTTLDGKTLRDIRFRERYGLSVLAIWRGGRPYRTGLNNMALRQGDALLLYGPKEKIKLLGRDPDFLVLAESAQEEPRYEKAPLAVLIMAGVVVTAMFGWLPIVLAAVIGATLMVVTRCLTMDEAYRFIEWRAVFLIAAMLPLGIAMGKTGAAAFLANGLLNQVVFLGPYAVMAVIFLLTLAATQFIPNPVVAVLMAPVVLTAAETMGISPYPLMLTLAFAASSSFLTPVGDPSTMLVMGPGNYRFSDYFKVGFPLAMVVMVVTLLVVPLFWPF